MSKLSFMPKAAPCRQYPQIGPINYSKYPHILTKLQCPVRQVYSVLSATWCSSVNVDELSNRYIEVYERYLGTRSTPKG